MIDSITDSTGEVIYQHKSKGVQVFTRATASIMDNLLKEVVVKGATTQFYSELKNVNGAAASADWMGKTGTTDNFADAWLVVSTPGITLGVGLVMMTMHLPILKWVTLTMPNIWLV